MDEEARGAPIVVHRAPSAEKCSRSLPRGEPRPRRDRLKPTGSCVDVEPARATKHRASATQLQYASLEPRRCLLGQRAGRPARTPPSRSEVAVRGASRVRDGVFRPRREETPRATFRETCAPDSNATWGAAAHAYAADRRRTRAARQRRAGAPVTTPHATKGVGIQAVPTERALRAKGKNPRRIAWRRRRASSPCTESDPSSAETSP